MKTKAIKINIEASLCSNCKKCEMVCPSQVFIVKDKNVLLKQPNSCISCGHCVAVCAKEALFHSKINFANLLPVTAYSDMKDKQPFDILSTIVKQRRSCRNFLPAAIEQSNLQDLVNLARFSPTSTNSQTVEFLILTGLEISVFTKTIANFYIGLSKKLNNPVSRLGLSFIFGKKTVKKYKLRMPAIVKMFKQTLNGNDQLFYGAPTVIVICDKGQPQLSMSNCVLAASNILLGAESAGFATCINGYALTALLKDKNTTNTVNIPKGYTAGAVLAIGKPAIIFCKIPPR